MHGVWTSRMCASPQPFNDVVCRPDVVAEPASFKAGFDAPLQASVRPMRVHHKLKGAACGHDVVIVHGGQHMIQVVNSTPNIVNDTADALTEGIAIPLVRVYLRVTYSCISGTSFLGSADHTQTT